MTRVTTRQATRKPGEAAHERAKPRLRLSDIHPFPPARPRLRGKILKLFRWSL